MNRFFVFIFFAVLPLVFGGCTLDEDDGYKSETLYKAPFGFPEISRHEHCQTKVLETSDKFMELAVVRDELGTAIAGEYYEQEFRAEVRNEPDDDDYDYHFEYSSGLTGDIYFTADDRTFRISGYPDRKGLFELYVKVYSDDLEADNSGTDLEKCQYHIDVERYVINVIDISE